MPEAAETTCIITLQADRPGGVPTVIDSWCAYLVDWGHEPSVLYGTFAEGQISRWERLKWTLQHWRLHQRPEHPNLTFANAVPPAPLWLMYFMPQWIVGAVLDQYDQLVFAGGPSHAVLPAALRGMPYVIWTSTLYEDELEGKVLSGDSWAKATLESRFWKFLKWQEYFVLRKAERVIVHSPYVARRIREQIPDIVDKVTIAPVPVELKLDSPAPDNIPQPYILTVSRINDVRKNVPLLLQAFEKVHKAQPHVTLVLAGDTPQQKLLDLCDELGIADVVRFEGRVSEERLTSLYTGASLFVLPSSQEGLGIVMLEAMACGTPVVATDCGGPEGIVLEGQTGQIVPNHNADAMADAITDLLSDKVQLAALSKGSIEYIKAHCSFDVVGQTLYEAFVGTFPESTAVKRKRYEVDRHSTKMQRSSGVVAGVVSVWAILLLGAYIARQIQLLLPAIERQLLSR